MKTSKIDVKIDPKEKKELLTHAKKEGFDNFSAWILYVLRKYITKNKLY